MANATTTTDDMGLVHLGMALLLVIGLSAAWHAYHAEIAYWMLHWAWLQLKCIDFIYSSGRVLALKQSALDAALDPGRVTAAQLFATLNDVGKLFVWFPIALSVYGLRCAHRHPANRTRRSITVDTLPKIMSSHSPAVIPTLYYGDLLNTDPEEHRRALNPEEWVEQHGLVINRQFQRDQCAAILASELGARITSPAELSPTEKAMFAIMGALLFSDAGQATKSQVLLDALNRSCHQGRWQNKPGYPDLSLCDAQFALYAAHAGVADWIARHPYPRTLLHAMHKEALRFGKLPSAHFRWLKGMDRPLWYALNTTGRKAPFIESAAVFTQTLWEVFAFDNGYRLNGPCIDDAVDGIESYLVKIGVIKIP
ncbi:MAG: conjugal transfer protein TrbA [Pseudomonadota bacterium]